MAERSVAAAAAEVASTPSAPSPAPTLESGQREEAAMDNAKAAHRTSTAEDEAGDAAEAVKPTSAASPTGDHANASAASSEEEAAATQKEEEEDALAAADRALDPEGAAAAAAAASTTTERSTASAEDAAERSSDVAAELRRELCAERKLRLEAEARARSIQALGEERDEELTRARDTIAAMQERLAAVELADEILGPMEPDSPLLVAEQPPTALGAGGPSSPSGASGATSPISGGGEPISGDEAAAKLERQLVRVSERNAELFNEVQHLRDAARDAEDRVHDMEREFHRLARKNKDLHHTLRQERDRRKRQVEEKALAEDKVAALSEHIEKLMVALRIEAQAKQRQKSSEKGLSKRIELEQRKAGLLRKKAQVAERVIVQLKEQAEMLSGQLQLADERYADLRSRLMIERKNKNTEAEFWKKMLEERQQDLIAAQSANQGGGGAQLPSARRRQRRDAPPRRVRKKRSGARRRSNSSAQQDMDPIALAQSVLDSGPLSQSASAPQLPKHRAQHKAPQPASVPPPPDNQGGGGVFPAVLPDVGRVVGNDTEEYRPASQSNGNPMLKFSSGVDYREHFTLQFGHKGSGGEGGSVVSPKGIGMSEEEWENRQKMKTIKLKKKKRRKSKGRSSNNWDSRE